MNYYKLGDVVHAIEFDSVRDIERTHPTTLTMIAALGWTEEQVDQMWQQALTL